MLIPITLFSLSKKIIKTIKTWVKDLKDEFIGMNIKQKVRMKFEKWIYFFESDFVGVNRLFVFNLYK